MQKKRTITLDESVYQGLRNLAGRKGIERFIEELVQPLVSEKDLAAEYKKMAADEAGGTLDSDDLPDWCNVLEGMSDQDRDEFRANLGSHVRPAR
jgi:hypothetical protein